MLSLRECSLCDCIYAFINNFIPCLIPIKNLINRVGSMRFSGKRSFARVQVGSAVASPVTSLYWIPEKVSSTNPPAGSGGGSFRRRYSRHWHQGHFFFNNLFRYLESLFADFGFPFEATPRIVPPRSRHPWTPCVPSHLHFGFCCVARAAFSWIEVDPWNRRLCIHPAATRSRLAGGPSRQKSPGANIAAQRLHVIARCV